MKEEKNFYLKKFLLFLLVTTIIEILISILNFYINQIPIDVREIFGLLFMYIIFTLLLILYINFISFFYECCTYIIILCSLMFCWESLKNLEDLSMLQISFLLLSLGLFSRIYLWKLHLDKMNKRNSNRKIKIDFSVIENSEEIFYRRISLKGNDKCSDLLSYFKKNYLNEAEDKSNNTYKFYIDDKLIYNITENGTVEYCQTIDFELRNFPIRKVLCSKVEITKEHQN